MFFNTCGNGILCDNGGITSTLTNQNQLGPLLHMLGNIFGKHIITLGINIEWTGIPPHNLSPFACFKLLLRLRRDSPGIGVTNRPIKVEFLLACD